MAIWDSIAAGRALDSYYALSVAGGLNVSLTTDQAIPRQIRFTGALTASILVLFPAVAGDAGAYWLLENATSGAFSLGVRAASGGATVTIAQNSRCIVTWNGTDMVCESTDLASLGAAERGVNTSISALLGITGGITGTGGLNIDKILGNAEALGQGMLVKAMPDTNYTLTGVERENAYLTFTGVLTAQRNVVVPIPPSNTCYIWDVLNGCSGGALQFIGATGTGIVVAVGKTARLLHNGTNVVRLTADL